MAAEPYAKPLPEPSPDTQPFWDGLKAGKLLLQTCSECGRPRHYPRIVCPHCYSLAHRWVEASGRGTVHSWTVAHHAFHPGFKSELPYTLLTVDLAEGVRMNAQLRNGDAARLRVGAPVRVAFERATDDLTLPVFVLDD